MYKFFKPISFFTTNNKDDSNKRLESMFTISLFKLSKLNSSSLFNFSINLIKTSAVASASLTALWAPTRDTPRFLQSVPRLNLFMSVIVALASTRVSRIGWLNTRFLFAYSRLIKDISNLALWATKTASLAKS